jgi:hypothetical protein
LKGPTGEGDCRAHFKRPQLQFSRLVPLPASKLNDAEGPRVYPLATRETLWRGMRPASVIGPLGERLTLDGLPPSSTTRWTPRRKAEVVAAVYGGLLTLDEACERYELTLEELVAWQRAVERAGLPGLRSTQVQYYRALWEQRI